MNVIRTLTGHFARALIAPPILTGLGVDYLRRTLASLFAILLVLGIFLPRLFSKKYIDLGALIHPEPYYRALHADTLFMIAVPMLIIGLAAVILAPMLFPDETDYRVLTPLPITRAQLFAAKLIALVIVGALAVFAVTACASVWFPFVTGGWHEQHALFPRVLAHGVATLSASAWTFAAVMAMQGVCLTAVPRRFRRQLGSWLQAAIFSLLLLSLPYVARMPSMEISSTRVLEWPLIALPPVWFAGLERWMLDSNEAGGYARVAALAGWASVVTVLLIATAYGLLFCSAETLAGTSVSRRRDRSRPTLLVALMQRARVRAPTIAVIDFICAGLTRSRLHQFVFLLIVAVGCALVIDHGLTVREGTRFLAARPRAVVYAAIAAPLIVALSSVMALRAVFLLPLDQDASWTFRLTEDENLRAHSLNGVAYVLTVAACLPALLTGLLLQRHVLGSLLVFSLPLTALVALVLVEAVLREWRRIPYTCSYLPGKRVMAYTLGAVLAIYALFVYVGAHTIRWSIGHPSRTLLLGGLLLATYAWLRRGRLREWGRGPLEFEDEDPLAVRSLGLLADERR